MMCRGDTDGFPTYISHDRNHWEEIPLLRKIYIYITIFFLCFSGLIYVIRKQMFVYCGLHGGFTNASSQTERLKERSLAISKIQAVEGDYHPLMTNIYTYISLNQGDFSWLALSIGPPLIMGTIGHTLTMYEPGHNS